MLQHAYFLVKIGADTAEKEHVVDALLRLPGAVCERRAGVGEGGGGPQNRRRRVNLVQVGAGDGLALPPRGSLVISGRTLRGSFAAVSKPTL